MKEILSCAVVGGTGRMGQHLCRLLNRADTSEMQKYFPDWEYKPVRW